MNRPKAGYTIRDHSEETSNVSFGIYPITGVNAQAFLTDWGHLTNAVRGIIIGEVATERAQFFSDDLSAAIPANSAAQRELKWLVRGYDERQWLDALNTIQNPNYQQVFDFTVPCPDTSLLLPNSDVADPSNVAIATFVTELEKLWRSDSDGQMRVIDIRLVGRNL